MTTICIIAIICITLQAMFNIIVWWIITSIWREIARINGELLRNNKEDK